MIFANVKEITIPEGTVKEIYSGNILLWSASRIPTEYQEVEYIRAASNQGAYLNLGFAFDTKATIYLNQYITSSSVSYIFGAAENSGKLRCCFSNPYTNGAGCGTFYGSSGSYFIGIEAKYVLNSVNEYILTVENKKLQTYNKTNDYLSTNDQQGAYTMTNNLYLFAQNYNGTMRYGSGTRQIHYFAYYDKNNDLICELIPCYRKSDGVIGMYDTARNIFLTNAGTGTFTKGADV